MKTLTAISLFFLVTCVPSIAKVNTTTIDLPAATGPTASEYIDSGMQLVDLKLWKDAAEAFSLALMSNRLNEPGRALSYWYIAMCNDSLRNIDKALGALSSFVIIAQDIMQSYSGVDINFVSGFGLINKLAWSRAYMNFTWTERSSRYGKFQNNPILVHNMVELEHFFGMVSIKCNGCNVQRSLLQKNGVPFEPRTEMLLMPNGARFFLVIPPRKETI